MPSSDSARPSAEPAPLPPVPELRNGSIPPDGPILDETWQSRSGVSRDLTDPRRAIRDFTPGVQAIDGRDPTTAAAERRRHVQHILAGVESIDRERGERLRARNGRDRAPDSPHPYSYYVPASRPYWDADGDRERQESSRPGSSDRSRRRPWQEYAMDGIHSDTWRPQSRASPSPDYEPWLRSLEDQDRQSLERARTEMLETSGAVNDMPPLHRMSHRNITDGPLPSSGLREFFVPAAEAGSRPGSVSSTGNADSWEMMFANVVPDTSLPTADSSFTSAAASASFSASNSNNSRSHSADSNSASSFRTHVTVPDAPADPPERVGEDWTCDTDSDEDYRRNVLTRRDSLRLGQPRDRPSGSSEPARRPGRGVTWTVPDDERSHMRRLYDSGDRTERRANLALQMRRSGVDEDLVSLFARQDRTASEHAVLLNRFLDLRHTMDDELFFMALADISRQAAADGRAALARQREIPANQPSVPDMSRDGHIFGYMPWPPSENEDVAMSSSDEGRPSHRSGSSSDDDVARPSFAGPVLGDVNSILSSLAGRNDVPESLWASVGLRRTALRYAREEEQEERSVSSSSVNSNDPHHISVEGGRVPPSVWDDARRLLRRFNERSEGEGSGRSSDDRGAFEEARQRRERRAAERVLDEVYDVVRGEGRDLGQGPQRDSHL